MNTAGQFSGNYGSGKGRKMPKFLETKLEEGAEKKGKKGKSADRYVYGAMNNMGAMRGNKETAKGKRMDAKHKRDTKPKKPRRRQMPEPMSDQDFGVR